MELLEDLQADCPLTRAEIEEKLLDYSDGMIGACPNPNFVDDLDGKEIEYNFCIDCEGYVITVLYTKGYDDFNEIDTYFGEIISIELD